MVKRKKKRFEEGEKSMVNCKLSMKIQKGKETFFTLEVCIELSTIYDEQLKGKRDVFFLVLLNQMLSSFKETASTFIVTDKSKIEIENAAFSFVL